MSDTITYTNVRIWDGLANEYSDHDSVSIQDGLVISLGEQRGTCKDLGGLTCIPGLIDAHVHMTLDPSIAKVDEQLKQSKREIKSKMASRAKAMVEAGITTARDLGGGDWLELELRDRIASNRTIGPRLLCAGRPITSPKGHCHFWNGECASVDDATDLIQTNAQKGVDLIKVMATGGMYTKESDPSKAQFSLEELEAFVDTAASLGFPIAAHCHGIEGIRFAAFAGVSTIEHCSWLNKGGKRGPPDLEAVLQMASKGVYVSPTINSGWARFKGKKNEHLNHVRQMIRDMKGMGTIFIASTDAGIPNVQHTDLPKALKVFAEYADFLPVEALKSATSVSAKALKISNSTGSIKPGLAADLLFVEGDPLSDLSALEECRVTLTNGREHIVGS